MKQPQKIVSITMALLILLLIFSVSAAAKSPSPLDNIPYIGEGTPQLSPAQAHAYARVIREFSKDLNAPILRNSSDEQTEITFCEAYAALVDTGGNTLLWLAKVNRHERESGFPGAYAVADCEYTQIYPLYEEIWEWDGQRTVKHILLGDYREEVRATLFDGGLMFYTVYGGTDVGGTCWSAYFPFEDGRIAAQPTWCQAWSVVSHYDFNLPEGSSELPTAEDAVAIFKAHMHRYQWPNLPFDWDRIDLSGYDTSREGYIQVRGGEGFDAFLKKIGIEEYHGYYHAENSENSEEALLAASWIAKNNGSWMECTAVARYLTKYAGRKSIPLLISVAIGTVVAVTVICITIRRKSRR